MTAQERGCDFRRIHHGIEKGLPDARLRQRCDTSRILPRS